RPPWHPPRAPAQPVLPARAVPVPALIDADADPVRGPGDHVRRAGRDLLVAARATVTLRRARARLLPDYPVPVGPGFDALGPGYRRGRAGALAADPARAHTFPPYAASRVTRRAARHRPVQRRLRRPAHRPPAFRAAPAHRQGRRVRARAQRRRLLQAAE